MFEIIIMNQKLKSYVWTIKNVLQPIVKSLKYYWFMYIHRYPKYQVNITSKIKTSGVKNQF